MNINEYLDRAKDMLGIDFDRELGRAVGYSAQSIHNYRVGKAWPSDETMIVIAELARVPVEQALLDLNCWRASGPHVRRAYEALRARFAA